MYAIPKAFAQHLTSSHRIDARLNASVDGSPFGVPLAMLPGATVKADATAAVRRTLDVTVQARITDPAVDPFTAEVFAEYAIITPAGDTLWVPAGVYVVTGAKEAGDGQVALTCADRWQRIQDARFEVPVTTSGNTVAAIKSLVEGADSRLVGTFVDKTGSTATHPASLWERDRDQAVQALAKSIGAEVVFDLNGNPVLQPIPSLPGIKDQGVWAIGRGRGGAKVASAREVSRDATFNAVAASGEPPDGSAPVVAVVRDTNTASRTYWGGPFGKKTRFYKSPLLKTTAQATSAAQGILNRALGAAWKVEVTALPHPGLEPGDVVTIEVSDGVWESHLIDGGTLPLSAGPMSLSTRTTASLPEEA